MRIIFSKMVEVWDFQILYFGLKIILHKYEKYRTNFRWPFQRQSISIKEAQTILSSTQEEPLLSVPNLTPLF